MPSADLESATRAIVDSLVAAPRLSLRNTRRLVRQSLSQTLSGQLHDEASSFGECAASNDFSEGIAAFLAKRPPQFNRA